jgi:hypothetical protein
MKRPTSLFFVEMIIFVFFCGFITLEWAHDN